jgi:hypothetical protein
MDVSLDKRDATVLEYAGDEMISVQEASLFKLIDDIRFGSIHQVEILDAKKVISARMSARRKSFLAFLRETQLVDDMTIHDGEVSYVNIVGSAPFSHVRKVKF